MPFEYVLEHCKQLLQYHLIKQMHIQICIPGGSDKKTRESGSIAMGQCKRDVTPLELRLFCIKPSKYGS